MEFIPSMKLDRRSIGVERRDRPAAVYEERLIALSSWMMILGTIRVICTFADLASAFLHAYRVDSVSWQMVGMFVEENHPFLALAVAWPLFLGIAVHRTRWPELVPAAGVTFLILSCGGLIEALAEWSHASADAVTFGSFHLTKRAILSPTLSDVTLGLLGAGQLLVEFATALRCLLLVRHLRGSHAQAHQWTKQEGAHRARIGRLAIYVSCGFLVLMIRLPVWSTYIEIINDSRIVREFVLKNDPGRTNGARRFLKLSKQEERMRVIQQLLAAGFSATNTESFLEAKEAYLEVISLSESSAGKRQSPGYNTSVAQARNNLAWLLATCPKTELQDPEQAVKHARAAVAIEPGQGNYWNTLGVALYRSGELDEANNALTRSMELQSAGDSFDWFFVAIIHHKQGRKEQSLQWYDKAVDGYHQSSPADRELYRFQVEAADELGLPKPAPPPLAPLGRMRLPQPMHPGMTKFPNGTIPPSTPGPKFNAEK